MALQSVTLFIFCLVVATAYANNYIVAERKSGGCLPVNTVLSGAFLTNFCFVENTTSYTYQCNTTHYTRTKYTDGACGSGGSISPGGTVQRYLLTKSY